MSLWALHNLQNWHFSLQSVECTLFCQKQVIQKSTFHTQFLYCKRHMSKNSYNDTQYRQKCRQKWTVCSYKSFLSQYAHSFMALDPTSNIWSMFCSMFVLLLFCFSFFWLMILNNVCYIYWIFNWMFKRMLLWGTHLK